MGREYFPPIFLLSLTTIGFIWFQFFELPRMKREREEAARKATTEAPESHSKSAE